MNNLNELAKLCKCSILIEINNHKLSYTNIEDYLKNSTNVYEDNVENVIIEKIIKNDSIVELQVYPDNPVGFYHCYHYDIDIAIDSMINHIKKNI